MLEKMKKNFNNNKYLYLTFLLATIIISIIYYLQKVSPFGENSTLTIDFYHQYGPMLAELRERILSGKNLFYSFTMSMGIPFFRNFLNYLASPFNLLLLFFSKENILTSFSFIIGLKAVFASTTLAYFIKKKFNYNSPLLTIIGLLYGFQAYFIAYYWNIMWLDGLIFLPLIILGIEKIINENKNILYIISLALMIIINYFISYMICIFSVIYFFVYLFIKYNKKEWKKALKTTVIFITSSILAGCLTAFLTLPLASSLSSISATHDTLPFSRYYDFNIMEFIISHLSGATTTVLASDVTNAPNVSCGIISICLFILFFTNSKISFKTKIGYATIYLILTLSFFLAPLDFIWHGFHVPNDLPYRFSFLYTFTFIIISAYSLIKLKDNKLRYIFASYVICLIMIIALRFYPTEQITHKMLNINAILISIYLIIYLIYRFYPKTKIFMAIVFLGVISIECIVRVNNNWNIDQKITDFYSDYNITKTTLNFIKEKDSSQFYRLDKTNFLTFNDSSWYNYYGITGFSSMTYENLAKLQRDLGIPGNEINSFYYKPNTPIYDAMFNIKYILGDTYDYYHYQSILINNTYNVFQNNYNLNLMFGVNKNIKNWNLKEKEPFLNQNTFIEKATNIKSTLEESSPINKTEISNLNGIVLMKYTFDNDNKNYYFYTNNSSIEFFVINGILYYNNEKYSSVNFMYPMLNYYSSESYNEKKVINFYEGSENIEIYIGYNYYNNNDISLYHLNEEKFLDAYNKLKQNELEIIDFKENKITALNNGTDTSIYTSIPYDDGWHVIVDGKQVETYKNGNALLGFDIPANAKEIKLNYSPPKFTLGILISLTSLAIIIIINIRKRKA